jgi:hypothetical protein
MTLPQDVSVAVPILSSRPKWRVFALREHAPRSGGDQGLIATVSQTVGIFLEFLQ